MYSNDLVVVLLDGHVGTNVSSADERRLLRSIHHCDQNKFVVAADQVETGGKCLQGVVRSIGAQQDWRCHEEYGTHSARRQKLGFETPPASELTTGGCPLA